MNDDDFDLFAGEMDKVLPLHGEKARVQRTKVKNKHEIFNHIDKSTGFVAETSNSSKEQAQATDDWQLRVSGVSAKDVKKLAQATVSQGNTLDLHGLSQTQAAQALADFIGDALVRQVRQVSIIHGRGLHSDDKPILKTLTYQWLEQGECAAYVLAATLSAASRGGASHVLLRRVKNEKTKG